MATFYILLLALLIVSVDAFGPATTVRRSTTLLNAVKLTITDETEPIENVLKRFNRAVNQSGHLMELRQKLTRD